MYMYLFHPLITYSDTKKTFIFFYPTNPDLKLVLMCDNVWDDIPTKIYKFQFFSIK